MPRPPIHWWRLEDVNPTIGSYAFSNRVGSPVYSSGKYANCAVADGNDCLQAVGLQLPTTAFTYEFWIYDTSSSSGIRRWITTNVNYNGNQADKSQFLIREQNGVWGGLINNSAGGDFSVMSGTWSTSQKNAWHHIAITFAIGAPFRFYLDGVNVFSSSSNASGTFSWPSNLFILGGYNYSDSPTPNPSGEFFIGKMDNMKIYNYVKADFSDRFRERGGMNDQILVA